MTVRLRRRSLVSRNYEREVLRDGPVFLWMLDDSASPVQDSTPNDSDGVVTGGATFLEPSIIPTTQQTCINFDGPAMVTSEGLPSVTEFTFECVVRADSLTGTHGLVQRDNNTADRYFYAVCVGTDLYFSAHDPSSTQNEIGPTTLAASTVYHLAFTRNASEQVISVNGVAAVTDAVATGARTGTTQVILLGQYDGDYWDGDMQGVAYHSTALSADRILAHARAAGLA